MDCTPGHPSFIGWCDHGRLIVAGPGTAERDELVEHLRRHQEDLGYRHLGSMLGYLGDRGVELDPAILPNYHLIEAPLPNVFNVINGLYRRIRNPGVKAGIDYIEPDQLLNIAAPQVRLGTGFSLTAGHSMHSAYKTQLNADNPTATVRGWPVPIDGKNVKVAVIDTGLEAHKPAPASYNDLVAPGSPQGDADGHGTAMAEIIRDIAPGVDLHVYRVTHSRSVFVWDMMAAVTAAVHDKKVDFVSLSMGCQNLSHPCRQCGGHGQNRSAVCQSFFDLMETSASTLGETIFIASVGNDGPNEPFEWPAIYDSVLAVGAINQANEVSSFSNAATATLPNNFCLFPGGDEANGNTEYVGEGQDGSVTTYCFGTSPATAYAAGVLALRKQADAVTGQNRSRAQFIDWLVNSARQNVMDPTGADIYDPSKHGMGRVDFTP